MAESKVRKKGGKGGNTVKLVRELVQPIADEVGVSVWDVIFEKEGASWYLKVLIDRFDGGLTMDDCEAVTRPLSKKLDEVDPIEVPYMLEVGSPGLGRALKKPEPEKAEVTPDKTAFAPEAEKPEIPTVKNLSQLKKAIKPGMMFEITDHLRPECIGERRVVTGVTTVDFTSRKLDENGEPTGKDLHMEFDRAKNWTFDGDELTSRLDNGDMLMSFHFIDSLEREQIVHAEKEPEVKLVADEVDVPETEVTAPDKGENFTITDDALGEGGAKAKFRANVDAIKTLKTLEREKRPATAEEKETLSKYVGWGALAKAFDKDDPKWAAEYKELSELLTPQEYAQARSTVNDAFYTSPTVIDGIYEALGNFGFDGGNVLEPAMGIGNFFGMLPEAMRESELHGVELDSLTGRIAQQLYPGADIQIKGFEKTKFANDSFDVVVGNVPFGDYKLSDKDYDKHKFYIHDYFVAKSIDKVRPGGIVAVVTSKGTMDKENPEMRKYVAQRAELLGAIRLPNNAFKANAGTEVTSDEEGQFILTGSAVPPNSDEIKHTGTGRFSWLLMRPMSLFESGEANGMVSLTDLFAGKQDIMGVNDLDINKLAFLVCRGVGIGIASDSNVMSRKVTAKVGDKTAKKTVNADLAVIVEPLTVAFVSPLITLTAVDRPPAA